MAEQNIEMNQYVQSTSSWNQLYPITKAENVVGLGVTVICTITPAIANVVVTLTSGANVYTGTSNASGVATINVKVIGLNYAVTFSDPSIQADPSNIQIDYYGFYTISAIKSVTYTAIIDETNSNPLTALTYADDAVGMTKGSSAWDTMQIFKDIKPCVLQNGSVNYYLNPNNYNQKIDGSASNLDGTDGDVMVEFKKFAYRIYRSGTNLYVSISNNPTVISADSRFKYYAFSRSTEGDRDYMYIGAYHGYTISSKLRSVSGQLPTVNQAIGTFRNQARANGAGYQQFTFYQLTALQCLYIIKYGNLNSQSALGMGYVNGSAATASGSTNANGMYYGTSSSTVHVKFAGIEDFWGNVYDWIDGLYSDTSRNILTSFSTYNDTGAGYVNQGQGAINNISGYMSKAQGASENGFVVKATSGTSNTYYCDDASLFASGLPVFGGRWADGADAGAFRLRVAYSASSASASIGARLSFC